MKLRIAIILILLGIFVSTVQAQTNCCTIKPGPPQTTGGLQTVPPSGSRPGGTFYPTLTETIVISCIDSSTSKPCNSQSTPNNVVTATGTYGFAFGLFIACNPTFAPTTTQSSSMGTNPSFKNVGTSYGSVDSSGNCVPNPIKPFQNSTCTTVACTPPPPPPPPPPCHHILTCTDGYVWDNIVCDCVPGGSPIILDINGKGFVLTNAANGVQFDISGTGHPLQMGWTASGADNAFLALPGADGLVHNGKQLFGNFTPQPASDNPNGFIALAVYDDPKNGGNGDGIIDSRDAIFASLRLWIDANHDGISQPDELHTLPSVGVNSISLKYKASEKTDQYGNVFRYRARVNGNESQDVGQTAYDVFFVALGQPTSKNIPRSLIPADAQKCAVPVPTKGGMLSSTGSR
jgi:hypothetical protein